jgi:heterodisulfide reductase subunit A
MVCGACFSVCPTASARLKKMSTKVARSLYDEFDEGLRSRTAIRIPFPQAVPNAAIIDRAHCVHFQNDACRICQDLCEADAIDFSQQEKILRVPAGAVIVASGSQVYQGKRRRDFGSDRYQNVVTSIEFERILSASGPFHGHVVRPVDRKKPKNIAFVQCVGSRDDEHPYCSAVCCMHATKEAVIAREHSPGLECTIFYMDIRAYGKGFDAYYEKAKKSGVEFIGCRPSSIDEEYSSKNLIIHYTDEQGKVISREFDMVVLSCGLQPPKEMRKLAQTLGLKMNADGFYRTEGFSPTDSSRPGIYVCGPCTEPKDIPETVTQSSCAAACAMELLSEQRHSLITRKEYPPEIDVSGQEPRIGVFICHCGINIGAYVDVPAVAAYARQLPGVVYAEDNLYTCSQDSQRRIIEMIREHKLNRIVVASCTPRTHEPLFRTTIREAGLNPYLFEMANIRDQCSWIHMSDTVQATRKAKDLVRMAVVKAAMLSALKRVAIDVTQKALVIGGGIAGMTASLSLAEQGYDVVLTEQEAELGGHARHIYYTLEDKNVQEFLDTLIARVNAHPLITICTGSRVETISGFIGNYDTGIRRADGEVMEYTHGVIIVATGAGEYQPTEYLYGKDKRIITQRQLEENIHMNGTHHDGIHNITSLVMIQCIGSREDGHPYCSRRCCSQAIKNALKLQEINPGVRIFVLYRDMRTYGFKEEFYTKAREAGVMFIRYVPEHKPVLTNGSGRLAISVMDPVLRSTVEIHPDLVVLSTGIEPGPHNERLAKMLKVPLNSDGYFLEAHVKLRPVDFATEGIFVAGLAHGPKFISETISQARAAAARAATILAHDTYYAEATVSHVDENLCAGCGVCSSMCPYNAIEMVAVNGARVSRINEALCKGCGTCVAACPSGAVDQYGFTRRQIMSMIESIKEW